MLPSFSDFRDALETGKYESCFADLGLRNLIQADLRRPENVSALADHLFQQGLCESANICLSILNAYHQWLIEQLE